MMGKKPSYTWSQAELRWLKEMQHKRSLKTDLVHFEWLSNHLKNVQLKDITKDLVESIAKKKEDLGVKGIEGAKKVKPATINRILALIRSVLNRAMKHWEWIDSVPVIRMRQEKNARLKWLTREQAEKLLLELPPHLRAMATLSLFTGLRSRTRMEPCRFS